MRERETKLKTLSWFYGHLTVALLVFFLKIFNGQMASCWDDEKFNSFDQKIFETAYSEVFEVVKYHYGIAIYVLITDVYCSFTICFNDAFILCMSILIHKKFEILNEKLKLNINVSENFCNGFFKFKY
jgi:Trehalose receptor